MKALWPVAVIAVLLLLWSSLFYVDERELAIKFQFGEIIKSDYEPGIHWKTPLFQNVRKFDKRILTIDAQEESFFTGEKKDLIVDSYVKWRIKNVAEYYKTTGGDELRAGNLLYQTIKTGLREEFGKRTIQEVVAGERSELMSITTEQAKKKAETLGIDLVDVKGNNIMYLPLDKMINNTGINNTGTATSTSGLPPAVVAAPFARDDERNRGSRTQEGR